MAFEDYLTNVKAASSHTAKEIHFLDFVRSTFGIDLSQFKIEERVYGGRVDVILGNLVLEFKTDLGRERDDATTQLQRYITQLKGKAPTQAFTGVVTDGINFSVFKPRFAHEGHLVQELEPLGELNLERAGYQNAFLWLDSLLLQFRQQPIRPTTQGIVADLGPASATFRAAQSDFQQLYRRARSVPAVKVRFDEWQKYLALVYGEIVGDEALFIKHTYLATVAKLIAHFIVRRNPLMPSQRDLEDIITGQAFASQGIANFIEDDFFTWFLCERTKVEAIDLIRRLAQTLALYDFSALYEDVLKGLYQELVDPETRHDLGEYYTPDWLAERMLDEVGLREQPRRSLLDPACGSGTFLFIAIRFIKQALANDGLPSSQVLGHILGSVMGIEVHPLAVIIARTNYLLALGQLLQNRGTISIPIYMADAIRLPVSTQREALGGYEEPIHTLHGGDKSFEFPHSVIENPTQLDTAIETMRSYLPGKNDQRSLDGYRTSLSRQGINSYAQGILATDLKILQGLYAEGKDTVWLYILKNQPKPIFLSQRKFDLVVGNPPWLSYRYIKNARYARDVKHDIVKTYKLLRSTDSHLFTHMELATLFYARTAHLYLREGGTIAFVMPRSVLVADQHANFTSFSLGEISFQLDQLWDLEQVEPLFNVPACVLIAQKGGETQYPVPALRFQGSLPAKNLSWADAETRLATSPLELYRIGGKLLPQATPERFVGRSYYADKFFEGATIVPRSLWFVQLGTSRLGYDRERPYLESDQRAIEEAKAPWDKIHMTGAVEAHFIYATLLGGDILPFGHRPFRPVVLPIAQPEVMQGMTERPYLLNRELAQVQGFPGLAQWLAEVQRHWEENARKDEKGNPKTPSAIQWLDYRRKLTNQLISKRYKVLYNGSGTNISCVVVDTLEAETQQDAPLRLNGFVADYMSFYLETDSPDEAHYLCGFLNSPLIDALIKPHQARGLWGERHIQKRPLRFRIPQFDPANAAHHALAALSLSCHNKAATVIPELAGRYRSVGRIRGEIRRYLEDELQQIDGLVLEVLS